MVRLTENAKEYIKKHPDVSSRKMTEYLGLQIGLWVSHTAIANYRKSLEKNTVKGVKFTKVTTPKVKREKKPVKPEFPLSIDKVNKLLQANKDHYWYEYLNKQLNGRLRSDFQKLLEFIRDTQ